MTRFILSAVAVSALLTACATAQENPHYQYSTKYKAAQPTNYASSAGNTQMHAAPVSYQSAATYHAGTNEMVTSHTQLDQACLRKEQRNELIGGALGGSVGAIAGKKLIGGTAGTVVGAGLGGTLGYGIGDKTVNCDPVTVHTIQPASTYQAPVNHSNVTQSIDVAGTAYSNQYSSNVTNASYQSSFTCPVGTTVQADGSCLQGSASASYVMPISQVAAPTDSHYQANEAYGTPGYQALQSQTYEAPLVAEPLTASVQKAPSYTSSSAQSIAYDYSENLVQANTPTEATVSETYMLGGAATHGVVQGDTVYSLSRKLCVGVTDIQSLNGLDQNYSIKIGDSLSLPASRC